MHVTLTREVKPRQAAVGVWQQIKKELAEQHKAQPAIDTEPTSVTAEDAWSAVRKFVHDRGFESMTVLIDEAQSLVPRAGARWGTELKNFVERHLTQRVDGLATVQLGLFGTVDLSVRVGQNCKDFLLTHGAEQFAFDETSLTRYLREAGQGQVQSTRAARVELATWANNLRTLKEVYENIRARLETESRLFMAAPDVTSAVHRLLSTDSASGSGIWQYARSELSHSDEWEPADSMPLALAWALQDPALTQIERLGKCVTWLNDELEAAGTRGEVPQERADVALRDLKARGVLQDNGAFYRPLLGELLARQPNLLRNDLASQLALLRLAVDVVEWPEEAAGRGEGAQAKVFIAEQGGRARAFRTSPLQTQDDGRRFARTCAALRTLRDRRTRQDGDDNLPKISQAGFRADDSGQGVVVYDWVEGQPLEKVWETLAADARVHVVTQVARGVAALHSRGILHCDIAPRNVIVNGRLEAVLIDFGLARHVYDETKTRLGGDRFKAPEQCADSPSASERSDVYAIGQMLLGPNPKASGLQGAVLDLALAMTQPEQDERPGLEGVLEVLSEREFDQRLHSLRGSVEDVIAVAPDYLFEDLLAFAPTVALVNGGLLPWDRQRALEVSDLLNKLFMGAVEEGRSQTANGLRQLAGADELSLARAQHVVPNDHESLSGWTAPEVLAVGRLRIGWAHPLKRENKVRAARQALGVPQRDELDAFRSAAKSVASMIDEAADAGGSLVEYIELVVGKGD